MSTMADEIAEVIYETLRRLQFESASHCRLKDQPWRSDGSADHYVEAAQAAISRWRSLTAGEGDAVRSALVDLVLAVEAWDEARREPSAGVETDDCPRRSARLRRQASRLLDEAERLEAIEKAEQRVWRTLREAKTALGAA